MKKNFKIEHNLDFTFTEEEKRLLRVASHSFAAATELTNVARSELYGDTLYNSSLEVYHKALSLVIESAGCELPHAFAAMKKLK